MKKLRGHGTSTQRTLQRIVILPTALLLVSFGAIPAASQETSTAAKGTVEGHLGKGYDALKVDRYDEAANEFRAALNLDPKLVLRARFPLAVALFELHQSADARREFEAVRREVGDHPNVLYYLGRLDLDDLNFEGAIKNLNQAVIKPPFPDTSYYLGYAYFKQGDLKAAEKWLTEAAHANPRDARIQYQLGFVYRNEGRQEEARKAMALSEELRQHDSNESKLRLECGQKLDQGPREEAHAVCEQLYDPDDAERLTSLGTLYGQHGDLEASLKPLRRAAELAPESPQMQYNLALAYYQLNQFEQARAPLAKTIQRWPDLFQLNALYGAVLLKLGENLGAYQALHRAYQLNPQDSGTGDLLYMATLGLGGKSQTDKQYSDSLRYFEEAAKLRPQEPAPHQGMAEVYKHTGHPARATAEQTEADRLTSNHSKLP
jgi:tetratricopeptide (TPR) repeat protein